MANSVWKRILMRYESGRATPVERFLVDVWFDLLQSSESDVSKPIDQESEKAIGERIYKRIHSSITPAKPKYDRIVRWGSAAAVLLMLSSSLFYLFQQPKPMDITYLTQSSAQGQVRKIVLPDSSEVWLNSRSKIRYQQHFTNTNREVTLVEGEAFFKVTHDANRPFQVLSDRTKTTVLGTQFVVSAYKDAARNAVQVKSGMVTVEAPDRTYSQLTAGNGVWIDKADQKSHFVNLNGVSFDPQQQKIFLENSSFEELAFRIEKQFGYRLTTASVRIKSQKYTGEIELNEHINTVLQRYCWINRCHYRVQGKEVQVYE